jgi:hypothetical protein
MKGKEKDLSLYLYGDGISNRVLYRPCVLTGTTELCEGGQRPRGICHQQAVYFAAKGIVKAINTLVGEMSEILPLPQEPA